MFSNLRNLFCILYKKVPQSLFLNQYSTLLIRDFSIYNKGFFNILRTASNVYGSHGNFYIRPFLYLDRPCYNKASSTHVDFSNTPLIKVCVNNLKNLGINNLKLFQYIIFKVLNENLTENDTSSTNKKSSRVIFYNDLGSGQTIGSLIPLLHLYSFSKSNGQYKNSQSSKHLGSLLILCSKGSCSKISNFIIGFNPSLKCLILDYGYGETSIHKSKDSKQIGLDYSTGTENLMSKVIREDVISRQGNYDVIIASHKTLPNLSQRKNKRFFPVLSRVNFVLFDDFSELIDTESSIFIENLKLVRESKKVNISDKDQNKDFHIICLISSIDDKFAEYSKRNLSNYSLYDFKHGTKQRLLSDSKTDVLKVDVDFGDSEVINLESGEVQESKGIEHSICKVSRNQKCDRITVLKNLVYSYLDLPTFINSQSWPMSIKKPTAKSKCIIFVSNRKQLTNLANLSEFSNISVHLGRYLNVYERAEAISSFNNGSKPIMIATNNSIYGSSFDDVSHIFNFNPPKTIEVYKSRAGFARKNNSLCVTLYSNDQYSSLVSVIKEHVKKISVHIVPSKEYMMKHDLKWLRKFTSQMINENKNLIKPYLSKAEDLLNKHGDSIITTCSNILLRDRLDILFDEDLKEDNIISSSILSGKAGFTAVVLNDETKQHLNDKDDVKKLFSRYIPDSKVSSVIGRSYKTEKGYIVDVCNKYLKNFIELSKENPDIDVQIATSVPKILLNENNIHIGKVHRKGLDWNSLKIRKPPRIDNENSLNI